MAFALTWLSGHRDRHGADYGRRFRRLPEMLVGEIGEFAVPGWDSRKNNWNKFKVPARVPRQLSRKQMAFDANEDRVPNHQAMDRKIG